MRPHCTYPVLPRPYIDLLGIRRPGKKTSHDGDDALLEVFTLRPEKGASARPRPSCARSHVGPAPMEPRQPGRPLTPRKKPACRAAFNLRALTSGPVLHPQTRAAKPMKTRAMLPAVPCSLSSSAASCRTIPVSDEPDVIYGPKRVSGDSGASGEHATR